nr:UvrD-helicase domain-containing protein [Kiritimatiellia bacterium]
EKAAGELKDRIRSVLEEADCLPPDFDEVTICTIHSFCRELLTEYAFENRVPMEVEIGGTDKDLIHRAVRTALQSDAFKARYGESYGAYMKAAALKSTDDLVSYAEASLKDCVQQGRQPEAPQLIDDAIRSRLSNIASNTSFDFPGIVVNARARDGFESACRAIEAAKTNFATDDLSVFVKTVAECAASCEKLNPSVNGHGRGVRLFDLRPDIKGFEEAVADVQSMLSSQMLADLVFLAWPEFKRLKEEVSALTFDDLVSRAHDVIVAESKLGEESALLKSIRHKYRIALVDEFQDTDKAQWDIFRCIFSYKVNKIEDGPEPKQGSLLVVGDPKQAIYSFRGADIATYLEAKRVITGGDDKKALSLDTTYRSSPALVKAFNDIFGKKIGDDHSWFEDMKEGDGSISYKDVKDAAKSARFNGIGYHSEFGKPVELIESLPKEPQAPESPKSGYGNKNRCLPEFLRNVAREIKRLVALNPAYTTVNKDTGEKEPHRFSYRDMCILVRGHADADTAREILTEAKIPFSIYKEQGIYASAEAEALLALFDFLSVPSRRGRLEALLLTPLFGYRPKQIEARLKQEDHDFASRLAVWQELVAKKKWCKFFECIMNDTLLAHPGKDDSDFDRRWSATRQILDRLLEQVGRKAQTIDEFADTLRALRQNDNRAGEDGALRRKESEADCVQIMTMHVSKGLEYPVVFIAWGFGELAYNAEPGEKEKAIREEKRLLYVALTRAEHKLYLPWSRWAQHKRRKCAQNGALVDEWDETGIGSVGSALLIPNAGHVTDATRNPDLGFLARGIRACFGSDDAAKAAVMEVSERLRKHESRQADEPKKDVLAGDDVAVPDITIYELDDKALARQKIDNDSYSSVHRKAKQSVEPVGGNGKGDENNDDASSQKKESTLLPRNNISGDVFHEIMETLCNNDDSDGKTLGFCTVGALASDGLAQNQDLLELIGKVMRKHQLSSQKGAKDETTELVLARMAWRALNVPINIGGKTIVLKDIDASNRRAELEFVVNRANMLGDELPKDGDPQRDSAFNGKIDLLIRPDGLNGPVYILDWKTNSLPDYGAKAMERSMTASDYHLQYRFYSQAVRYWLRVAELGGVAYMFVRAGEQLADIDGGAGVFVAKAEDISQEACRTAIKEALK